MNKYPFIVLLFLTPISIFSQLHPSAAFQISSTTQGFLLPKMTRAQIEQINNPADGLMVICTDCQNESGVHIFNNQNKSWIKTTTASESFYSDDGELSDSRTVSLSTYKLSFTDHTNSPALVLDGSTGNVGMGTASPHSSAALQISSTTKAFLPPRMTTTQRDNAFNTTSKRVTGMVIYNTTENQLETWNGTKWSGGGINVVTDQAEFEKVDTKNLRVGEAYLNISNSFLNIWNGNTFLSFAPKAVTAETSFTWDKNNGKLMEGSPLWGKIKVIFTNETSMPQTFTVSPSHLVFSGITDTDKLVIKGGGPVTNLAVGATSSLTFTTTSTLGGTGTLKVVIGNKLKTAANIPVIGGSEGIVVGVSETVTHSLDLNNDNNYTGTAEYTDRTYKEILSPVTGRIWLDRNIGATRLPTSITDIPILNNNRGLGYYYSGTDAQKACPPGYSVPSHREWCKEFRTNVNGCDTGAVAGVGSEEGIYTALDAYNYLKIITTRFGGIDGANSMEHSTTNSSSGGGFYWSSTVASTATNGQEQVWRVFQASSYAEVGIRGAWRG